MSVCEELMVVAALMLLPACKGSASAKVNTSADGNSASLQAHTTDKPKRQGGEGTWEDSDEAAAPSDEAPQPGRGRRVARHVPAEAPTLTLPGFRMLRDGGSRVFVEVSANVPVKENRTQSVLRYRFDGVQVPARVNTMDLPTRYFPTPVSRVHVVKLDGGAELVIELRVPTKPKVRLRQSDDGTVLSIDFPRLGVAEQAASGPGLSAQQAAPAPGR